MRRSRRRTPTADHFRDVGAFEARAPGYDAGRHGQLHHRICEQVARIAAASDPDAESVLDVGCGTGYLLGLLADGLPSADRLIGVDAAPGMIEVATANRTDAKINFLVGAAEELPVESGRVDLLVSSTSFDHWRDQAAGLGECHRVLRPGGRLVICDLISTLLLPTLIGERRAKARTPRRVATLITAAGFDDLQWGDGYTVLIKTILATRGA